MLSAKTLIPTLPIRVRIVRSEAQNCKNVFIGHPFDCTLYTKYLKIIRILETDMPSVLLAKASAVEYSRGEGKEHR